MTPMPASTSEMPALAIPRLLSGVRRTAYASPEASTRSASRPGSGSSATRRSTPNWYRPTTARVPAAAVCSTAVRRRCLEEVTGAATQRIGHGLGGQRDAPADAAAAGADGGCRWAGGAGSGCHRLPLHLGSGLLAVTQRRIPAQPPCPPNRPSPPCCRRAASSTYRARASSGWLRTSGVLSLALRKPLSHHLAVLCPDPVTTEPTRPAPENALSNN